jgi:hypothetical protein
VNLLGSNVLFALFMLNFKLIFNEFVTPSSYETFPNKYSVAYTSILNMEPGYSPVTFVTATGIHVPEDSVLIRILILILT